MHKCTSPTVLFNFKSVLIWLMPKKTTGHLITIKRELNHKKLNVKYNHPTHIYTIMSNCKVLYIYMFTKLQLGVTGYYRGIQLYSCFQEVT
jgi:hypothetical protein